MLVEERLFEVLLLLRTLLLLRRLRNTVIEVRVALREDL